ncbi:hypothetical protein ABZ806_18360 [Spirillospora sp. NPDC047418]|jgi:hypothetical protein
MAYSADRIRATTIPAPVRRGAWWEHSWTITAGRPVPLDEFELPAPLVDDEEGMTVVTLRGIPGGGAVLGVFEVNEIISARALVLASQIVNAVRAATDAEVLVDGAADSPLFSIIRRPDQGPG